MAALTKTIDVADKTSFPSGKQYQIILHRGICNCVNACGRARCPWASAELRRCFVAPFDRPRARAMERVGFVGEGVEFARVVRLAMCAALVVPARDRDVRVELAVFVVP